MSLALQRLAQRILKLEKEVLAARTPQLAYSSVTTSDGTEVGVVSGIETGLVAHTKATNAQASADTAQADAIAAQQAAQDASALAQSAQDAATQAQNTATTAQQTADGKNTVTRSPDPASGSGATAGDLWFQIDANGNVTAQWTWDGTAWKSQNLSHQVLASLDLGKATVGTLDVANRVAAGSVVASKLAVGDMSNMSWVNTDAASMTLNAVDNAGAPASCTLQRVSDGTKYWVERTNSANTFFFRDLAGPIPFKAGDRLRFTFDAYLATAGDTSSATVRVRYPDGTGWNLAAVNGSPTTITDAAQSFQYEGDVADFGTFTKFTLLFASSAGKALRVRNVRVYRMGAGELVVDGSIKANHLSATAIDGKTITGVTITGTSTVTGATVQTAASGPRVLLKQDVSAYGADPGALVWMDDAVATVSKYPNIRAYNNLNPSSSPNAFNMTISSGSFTGNADAATIMLQSGASSTDPSFGKSYVSINAAAGVMSSAMAPQTASGTGDYTSTGAGLVYPTQCAALTFTAPASGRVKVTVGGLLKVATAGSAAYFSFEIRQGGTVRAGTVVQSNEQGRGVTNYNTQFIGASRTSLVTGLTAGATYNAYVSCYAAAANAIYSQTNLLVEPSL